MPSNLPRECQSPPLNLKLATADEPASAQGAGSVCSCKHGFTLSIGNADLAIDWISDASPGWGANSFVPPRSFAPRPATLLRIYVQRIAWMAAPSPAGGFDTPVNSAARRDASEGAASLVTRPLSGPGASRQTRRLQLRNAGFRGSALPSRKVTPMSQSSSTKWSPASGVHAVTAADTENVSPSGVRAGSVKVDKRRPSGILQEIGNTMPTVPRASTPPNAHPPRLFGENSQNYDSPCAGDLLSPPPPRSSGTIRIKPGKARAKVGPKRRSISGEARMYIEHLESELASAQSQLSAINSPSVTREQTSKVRTLNAETRQLQQELADWEAKYEQRVQQELDRHHEIEAGLRMQIRKLEDVADEMKFQLENALSRAATSAQDFEAAEAANVNLEKRLEIMSGLLAASPTKIDLHAETPGTRRRPKSMLPRFPTASSLVTSPVREPPVSPSFAFPALPSPKFQAMRQPRLAIDTNVSPSDLGSDVESVFSSAHIDGDSMTSLEPESQFAYNAWTQHAVRSAKDRPSRRMRKFGAGCTGPRPLILPATAHSEYVPVSAPAYERSETMPVIPSHSETDEEAVDVQEERSSPSSPYMRRRASTGVSDGSPSSRPAHRRALTMADERTLAMLIMTQLPRRSESDDMPDESLISLPFPPSTSSQLEDVGLNSNGPAAGRNLADELSALNTDATDLSTEVHNAAEDEAKSSDDADGALMLYGELVEEGADVHSVLSGESSEAQDRMRISSTSPHDFQTWQASTSPSETRTTLWQRLRLLFGDLWHSPVALARYLIQRAALKICIPEPLRNVQWWLVGALLGPMARRRMFNTHACNDEDVENQSASESSGLLTSGNEDDSALAYGTIPATTPDGQISTSRPGTMSGKGKKRIANRCRCPQHAKSRSCASMFTKHSPWMWLKFSITLAFAVGVAFKDGPASLLRNSACGCRPATRKTTKSGSASAEGSRQASAASFTEV